jgi:hypothetical protein
MNQDSVNQSGRQDFRIDIYKLLRDEVSIAIIPLDADGIDPLAGTLHGDMLTKILREDFGFDDRSLCDLGMELAAQGRATATLHCTQSDLRASQLIAAS